MTVSLEDLREAKDKLEEDIEELLYRFEKINSFAVTDIKINRRIMVNDHYFRLYNRRSHYNVKVNITL